MRAGELDLSARFEGQATGLLIRLAFERGFSDLSVLFSLIDDARCKAFDDRLDLRGRYSFEVVASEAEQFNLDADAPVGFLLARVCKEPREVARPIDDVGGGNLRVGQVGV